MQALVASGVTHAFCVPGESFLGLLDALYDEPRIRVIATRHEGGASFMAEGFGKSSGRPALCMGTRMVGGGNLAIGVHTASQDSTPLLAMMGQVSTEARYREAFQEVDLAQVFGGVAKWAAEPPSAARLGELALRAGRIARSGRPGPTVLALREDLLNERVPALEPRPLALPRPAPSAGEVAETLRLSRAAERPILLVGQGVLSASATQQCVRLAELEAIPAIAAWRRPDAFPNEHPLYLGHAGVGAAPAVVERLTSADLVIALGVRLDENTTALYRVPAPSARLVHVDLGFEDLGGHVQADVASVADAALFGEALILAALANPLPPYVRQARLERARAERLTWERQSTPSRGAARPGFVDQQAAIAHLRAALPPETITTTDAGNFGGWVARYGRWTRPGTFLGPISGAMGYAIPAAMGARLAHPGRQVVALMGDGGFLMAAAEIETAVREDIPFVGLVFDNRQYGTIRMHQEREHPGRPIATALGSADLAGVARALGGLGLAIRDDADLPAAIEEARQADRPAILHLCVDPEQISVSEDSARARPG